MADEAFTVRWTFEPNQYAARVMPLIWPPTAFVYALSSLLMAALLKWLFTYVPLPNQYVILASVLTLGVVGGVLQHRYYTLPQSVKQFRGQAFHASFSPEGLEIGSPDMVSKLSWRKIERSLFRHDYGVFYYGKSQFVVVPLTAEQFASAERFKHANVSPLEPTT